jgi:hypothetical protein
MSTGLAGLLDTAAEVVRRFDLASLGPLLRACEALSEEESLLDILIGFLDIHRRLAKMESQMVQALEPSPFCQFVNDLSPTEIRVVQDYFHRLRGVMLTCLDELGIPLEVRRTSLRWTLRCSSLFLLDVVADMGPDRLRGYGELSESGAAAAVRIQEELRQLIDTIVAFLRQGLIGELFEERPI